MKTFLEHYPQVEGAVKYIPIEVTIVYTELKIYALVYLLSITSEMLLNIRYHDFSDS